MHRRQLLKTSGAVAILAALPGSVSGLPLCLTESWLEPDLKEYKTLLFRAIEAARSAGANYADAQVCHRMIEAWSRRGNVVDPPNYRIILSIRVRALVKGFWGFAAADTPIGLNGDGFTPDDIARLGTEAATQGKNSVLGALASNGDQVGLAPVSVVENGNWVMPIEIDPFAVDSDEKIDFLMAVGDFYSKQAYGIGTNSGMSFTRDARAFASSEGSFFTQTTYVSGGGIMVGTERHFRTNLEGRRSSDFATPSGAGWEYIRNAPFKESAERLIEEAQRLCVPKPVDIGRYEVVFDAYSMARILDATIGAGTDLERALGYQANSIGTSFLSDPLAMLGSFKVSSKLVNITANRSMKGGAATVKWDDEGVEPRDITLVKDGIIADFQTTRETAPRLEPYYSKTEHSVRSNGCAGSCSATIPQKTTRPNLILEPSGDNESFESLISTIKKGFAVIGGNVTMDHQCLNGVGTGELVYEVVNGRIGNVITGANHLFRTPDFWRNVSVLGGKSSVRTFGLSEFVLDSVAAGAGGLAHSVSAVPAKVSQVVIARNR